MLFTKRNENWAWSQVNSSSVKQCLPSVNHEQFPMQMAHKRNKWLQILAEEDFSPKQRRLKIQRKQRRRRRQQETAEQRERRLAQRRQRRQQETEEQRNRRLEYQRHYDCFTPLKTHIYSLPVFPPIYRSKSAKFQPCTTARSIVIFMRTALPYLCFVFVCFFSKSGGRNNAKYAFQYTFKNNTTQYAEKKKKRKQQRMELHDDVDHMWQNAPRLS